MSRTVPWTCDALTPALEFVFVSSAVFKPESGTSAPGPAAQLKSVAITLAPSGCSSGPVPLHVSPPTPCFGSAAMLGPIPALGSDCVLPSLCVLVSASGMAGGSRLSTSTLTGVVMGTLTGTLTGMLIGRSGTR